MNKMRDRSKERAVLEAKAPFGDAGSKNRLRGHGGKFITG